MASTTSRNRAWLTLFSLCLIVLLLGACAGSRNPISAVACCEDPCEDPCDPCAPVDPCADGPADKPPEANVGEAWCRYWIPPVTKTVTERVCVCPKQCKKVWVPPEYGYRPKLVCVAPANVREVCKPGLWTTKDKDVLVKPEQEMWCKTCCKPTVAGEGESQCECYVKKVKPAVWGTRKERVCVAPSKLCVEYSPARYKCVEERYLIKEGFCQTIMVPAKYETRTREVCTTPGRWEWRRNEDCEVPVEVEEALPALEVRMDDKAADGSEEGIFRPGDTVVYKMVILSDAASEAMPNLKVAISLPEHLEFVSGRGEGVTFDGGGQSATSSVFPLGVGQERAMEFHAKVLSAPPTKLVQVSASVQMEDGTEVAVETESTTLHE